MKLAALFVIGSVCAASAQTFKLPVTVPLTVNGKTIGTVTEDGNRLYLRNLQGEHFGTVEFGKDGTRTAYDPNGKIVHQFKK